jgi:hypothetical protein
MRGSTSCTSTTEKIIADDIRPAAYALTDDVDQKLCALYERVVVNRRFTVRGLSGLTLFYQ